MNDALTYQIYIYISIHASIRQENSSFVRKYRDVSLIFSKQIVLPYYFLLKQMKTYALWLEILQCAMHANCVIA